MRRRLTILLLLVAAGLAGCTSSRPLPSYVRVAPPDDALARRVVRILDGASCRFGFAAVHVESGRRLEVRGEEPFEGASAYKLAMLVEAAARVRDGRLDLYERWRLTDKAKAAPYSLLDEFEEGLEPSQRDLLRLMISISDNTAANHFYDLFGKDALNRRMESLGLSGIRVLERIPDRAPKEIEDERWKGLVLSAMTPAATAELYRRVATRTLLDPRSDRLVEDVLKTQRSFDRLPRAFLSEKGVTWAGKTGTRDTARVDSGILTTRKGHFVLVAFANGLPGAPFSPAKANDAMAEAAREVVSAWSAVLPDVEPRVEPPLAPTLAFPLERAEMTLAEARNGQGSNLLRVYRDEDRRFWELYRRAGGDAGDACLVPVPNSWWEGDDPWKIEPISALVLHHTSQATDDECLSLFLDPKSRVSSHFLVGRSGRLYQFVSLEHRSWHAGVSRLHGRQALNHSSIGVEITGDGNLYPYTPEEIDTVARLVGVLVAMYGIEAPWIAGHEHVAPDRKDDPGTLFPWNDVVRRSLEVAARLKGAAGP